jgi:hypothetical protein
MDIDALATGVGHLCRAFAEAGLNGPSAIYVPPETGLALRAYRGDRNRLLHHDDNRRSAPDYCATLLGVPIHMER